MARRGVQYQAEVQDLARPAVPRWWRGPDPDPAVVGRLYVQEGRTETEIAVLLSISRARVTAVLRDAGIPRWTSRKDGPVGADTLREIVRAGGTAAAVAREYGVSPMTAARWLAEAGLLGADPGVDLVLLRELYVDRQLTTREVAAELGINKGRVIRALAAAGIPRRPRSVRRPRGARAAVTDTALAEVYVFRGQRRVPAAADRRSRVDPTARHVRPAVGVVAAGVAGQGGAAVRDRDDHAAGRRPARGVPPAPSVRCCTPQRCRCGPAAGPGRRRRACRAR